MTARQLMLLGLVAGLLAAGLSAPGAARADVQWLCHSSIVASANPCELPLDTTVIAPDVARALRRSAADVLSMRGSARSKSSPRRGELSYAALQ